MRQKSARIHNVLAWWVFVGAILQILLISQNVFGAIARDWHWVNGNLLYLVALLMVVTSLITRSSRANVILTVALFLLLFPVQAILAQGDLPRWIKGLHGLNGMLIMFLARNLARGRARATLPEQRRQTVALASAATD